MLHKIIAIFVFGIVVFLQSNSSLADQVLVSHKTDRGPTIDGIDLDAAWQNIEPLTSFDSVANIDIQLKSVHTDKKIFFLINFPDKDESRAHRMWQWNKEKKMYDEGAEREDVFVLKWALTDDIKDITLKSNIPYEADVWYWKANRTDPQGFADDKIQRLFMHQTKNTNEIVSQSGKTMFLQRSGDTGKSAYKTSIFVDYEKDIMERYTTREPEGSRADVTAKGMWKNGRWTIEFARRLTTGNDDDVDFRPISQSYTFGVSRYEIAGRDPNPEIEQPLFGSGEITEQLLLQFR
jgi:hypothetical protein